MSNQWIRTNRIGVKPMRPPGGVKGDRSRVVGLFSLILALATCGCWGEHQIGTSKEAFKAVDALYTAVGLRDPRLLDQCEGTLESLHQNKELPDAVAESLNSIIAEAKEGSWEIAQERLSRFMEGQHR
jgi:hypothetical protein